MMAKKYLKIMAVLFSVTVASPVYACISAPPEEKIKELDTDGDNKISVEEYEKHWMAQGKEELARLKEGREFSEKYEVGFNYEKRKRQIEEFRTPESARKAFDQFDADKDGFITVEEMKAYEEANPSLQKC